MTTILRRTIIVLVVLVFNSAGAWAGGGEDLKTIPLADQPQDLVNHIVWEQKRAQFPTFLPAPILQREGFEGISMDPSVVAELENRLRLEASRQPGATIRCSLMSETSIAKQSDPNGRTLAELLESMPLTARGTVRAVVPGWALGTVMTMVYVEVEEILSCRPEWSSRTVMPGDVVSTTMDVGSFELEGLTICNDTAKAARVPAPGDQVIIAGIPKAEDRYFLGPFGVPFLIEDGRVLPQPLTRFRWEPVPLTELREALGGPLSICPGERQ
jgi:hypothetical protein